MAQESKSFADVLTSLLSDWKRLTTFLFLIAVLAGMLLGFIWVAAREVPKETAKITIGPADILFTQVTKTGREYLVIVYPQGWQETAIQVAEGDTLTFEAGGYVQIDLQGLIDSVEERRKAEDRVVEQEKRLGRWEGEKGTFHPEQHFTKEEKSASTLRWNWTDPNGNPETNLQATSRRAQSIMKDQNYGALLGAIRETQAQPDREDAFFIGRNNIIRAKRSGKLYLTVNDVWDDSDPEFPEKFFVDNIGSFYAKVTVTPPK
jgi:hypothetical protein